MDWTYEHWGVVVKPGETVKCDPGELYCVVTQIVLLAGKGNENVEVFVKVDGNLLLIATLSVFRHPQYATELIFEKGFELTHNSKTSNISVIGYKFSNGDESKETKTGSENLAAPRCAAAQSSKPKVTLEKSKNPGKLNAVGRNDDYENAKDKNRSAETPLKMPADKKAKIRTPSTGKNSVSGSTRKKRGHVRVATPYPTKQVKMTPSICICPGYVCKSCSKSFYSPVSLEIHRKLKKHGGAH